MRPPPKVHYLPGNHKVWTPPAVIYLDTETTTIPDTTPEVLTLALWCAKLIDRRTSKGGKHEILNGTGTTAAELATWVQECMRGRGTVWLYAHNLSFDIATTRLPLLLARDGWTITDAAVTGAAPWMRLVNGSAHITMVDSYSWLPHPLSDVGEAVGIPKPPLPGKRAPAGALLERCRADVKILATAMEQLHGWWDDEQLGRWTISGAGCGWNAMRHIKPPVRPTIDPDPAGVASDRGAIHGGRRGAWIVGSRSQGPFLELDFRNAYPTVAAELAVPSRRMAPFTSLALDNWRLVDERWGVIAEVELHTDVPRWPMRYRGATWLPTGHFRATLAGPEIKDALRLGCLAAVGAGYLHQLQPWLAPWARWVLDTANSDDPAVPPVARLAAKSWSRSVIGKTATRGYTKTIWGPSPVEGWGYEEAWDDANQVRGAVVDIGGQRSYVCGAGDAEQAYPAVLAWVESETRVRLTRVIEAIGERAVFQCDTDGLIVSERLLGTASAGGHLRAPDHLTGPARTKWVLDQIDPIVAPLVLRIKAKHKTIRVLGPQHHEAPGQRTLSGIPRAANKALEHHVTDCTRGPACTLKAHHRVIPDAYTFKTWPKLAYQMSDGDPRGYVRPESTVHVRGPYAPGWVTTMGTVVPPEAGIGRDGLSRLLGWHETTRKPAGARLADTQHPILAALW